MRIFEVKNKRIYNNKRVLGENTSESVIKELVGNLDYFYK